MMLEALIFHDETHCLAALCEPPMSWPETSGSSRAQFDQLCEELGLQPLDLNAPLPLDPVFVPKPWGQEIWYTGIEERGVSGISDTPLAWVVDLLGDLIGCPRAPLLLKILDPYPDENLGDLYFEMHEQKVEVYVVTHISPQAWPDGQGAIRYGFNPERVAALGRDTFLSQYVEAVERYQQVRNDIDTQLAQTDPAGPGTPQAYRNLMDSLPVELSRKEEQLRSDMYSYTQLQSLSPGDVITVEPLVPHSLQHGVRVVEFQTPHYERYILSFGQKVLTQDHWDTRRALEKAITDPQQPPDPVNVSGEADLITSFDAFHVLRYQLSAGQQVSINADEYQVAMGVTGTVTLLSAGATGQHLKIGSECAALCPAHHQPWILTAEEEACLLIAREGPFPRD